MPRRTVSLPKAVDDVVREIAEKDGQSYSAAVARLIEAGARALRRGRAPSYIGAFSGGPRDFGLRAERYLREAAKRQRS